MNDFSYFELPFRFSLDTIGRRVFEDDCMTRATDLAFNQMEKEGFPIRWTLSWKIAVYLRRHYYNVIVNFWHVAGVFPLKADVERALNVCQELTSDGQSEHPGKACITASKWLLDNYDSRNAGYAARETREMKWVRENFGSAAKTKPALPTQSTTPAHKRLRTLAIEQFPRAYKPICDGRDGPMFDEVYISNAFDAGFNDYEEEQCSEARWASRKMLLPYLKKHTVNALCVYWSENGEWPEQDQFHKALRQAIVRVGKNLTLYSAADEAVCFFITHYDTVKAKIEWSLSKRKVAP